MPTHLITGATRGIGRQVVDALADDDLILLGRDGDALDKLAAGQRSATPLPVDLSDPGAIAEAVERAELPERLDGLVHSAGIAVNGRLDDLTVAAWTEQLTVNVTAVAELTRVLLPRLRAAKGTVVMVNSGAGRAVKRPGGAAYAASKHALIAVADGLRVEEPDLRVTTVLPGRVATEMQQELRRYEGAEYDAADYIDPATVAQVIVTALRLPRDATMTEVAVMPPG